MRPLVLSILTIILAFTSCKGKYNTSDEIADLYTNDTTTYSKFYKDLTGIPTLEYCPIRNDKYEVIGAFPFPSDWYLGDNEDFSVLIQHPSGAKVFKSQSNYFRDYRSSKLNKKNKDKGIQTAALKTIETLIKEDFMPFADSLNIKLTHQFEIPELAVKYKNTAELYISLDRPKENTFKVIATEWLNDQGIKSIVVIKHQTEVYEEQTVWRYTLYTMEAPEVHFETSKETFLYSLKNYKTCYQHIYEFNKIDRGIPRDNSCVYYSMKQRKERQDAILKEAKRTGMYLQYFDGYLEYLKSKGFLTDMDTMDICNLIAFNKNEKDKKRYADSLWTSSSQYIPSENPDYEGWTEISD